MHNLQIVIDGWVNYFKLAGAITVPLKKIEYYVRVGLRMCQWKAWKREPARIKGLLESGASKRDAYRWTHSSKGYIRAAQGLILSTTLTFEELQHRGYRGFMDTYYWKKKRAQTTLF